MILISNKVGGAPIPVLTDYPVQDETKAGQRFWYGGNEWEYLTEEKINILGWNAEPGFPAPIGRNFESSIAEGNGLKYSYGNNIVIPLLQQFNIDAVGFGYPNNIRFFSVANSIIGSFKNLKLFTALEDQGTNLAFNISNCSLNSDLINNVFEQLPITVKVATIKVSYNPGAATCTPAIATAKGYIVVV